MDDILLYMTNEGFPKTKEQLLIERDQVVWRLRFKEEQTEANIQAGVVKEGAPDEDNDADEAELAAINAQLAVHTEAEQDAKIVAAQQGVLPGVE